MTSTASYRTVAAALDFEIPKIKGSRFLAFVAPVQSEADAMEHVALVRKLHHAARHVCWAWRTRDGGRSSDDGEPSGSAGRPILQAIEGAELTEICVAVVRYFGGTKLGVGGLVRAYGGAAAEALERCEVRVVVPMAALELQLSYEDIGLVEAFLAREGAPRPETEYGAGVRMVLALPASEVDDFAERLVQGCHGRVSAARSG